MALNATSVGMGRRNRFFLCMCSRKCIVITIIVIIIIIVYIVVVVNSMHLQSTYTRHSQRLQSYPHLKSGRKSVAKYFCGNSLRVKAVSCFRRKAPSLMLDGILNLTLRRRFAPLGLHWGIAI